jgi:cephalosporin-C deacetylase
MMYKKKQLEKLLAVKGPKTPPDFSRYWKNRYGKMLEFSPRPRIYDQGISNRVRVFSLEYRSIDGMKIHGWLTLPTHGSPSRGFVILHGYDGREKPDSFWPFADAAVFYPCCRGLGASRSEKIPQDPQKHVLHGIESIDDYVLGGCVEDTWLAFSAMFEFFPELKNKTGLLGTSFGGGIAALTSAWDNRISRVHLNVPGFGHQPLRLKIKTVGSALALQQYYERHGPEIMKVLPYFDAASAAAYLKVPVHCACALEDEMVAPEGQFAIYNCLAGPKSLFVLNKGHCDYIGRLHQRRQLLKELTTFFSFTNPKNEA